MDWLRVKRNYALLLNPFSMFVRFSIPALSFAIVSPLSALTIPDYEKEVLPILEEHCYDCHGEGVSKGKVSLDEFANEEAMLADTHLWMHVLKNVRGALMPPPDKDRLSAEEVNTLISWVKFGALKLDPAAPDPGRVTLRRLNRKEYSNTIRDLMGIEFRADEEFPADDTGYGFDTIGDVLSISPLLLEKYMQASEEIVAKAVPLENRESPEHYMGRDRFRSQGAVNEVISLYDAADMTAMLDIKQEGTYRVILDCAVGGSFHFDPGKAQFTLDVDGKQIDQRELVWHNYWDFDPSTEVKWKPGQYPLRLQLKPLQGYDKKPPEIPGEGFPFVDFRLYGIRVIGPLEPEFAYVPDRYRRFFPRDTVPQDSAERMTYAEEIMRRFATRAFRRPVDEASVKKLASIAMTAASLPESSFEKGIAKAMTAVIASPRFLFRMEETLPEADAHKHPLIDEYALASRLSYFLWSTMPDQELIDLAARSELRKNLPAQVQRMIRDERSRQLVSNFAGQWLQTRDVESVSIDARVVVARDEGTEKEMRERFERFMWLRQEIGEAEKANNTARVEELRKEIEVLRAQYMRRGKRPEFEGSLRTAMRREAEMLFSHIIREDRSVLELLDNDSTFLNEELARHYGIAGVEGGDMRLVKLPPDSPRGGLLTMGSVLAVTSNPTRTSPVKRGLFILDNFLGTPPPPPPANVASLEASEKKQDGSTMSLRDALAMHREKPLCASCHNRMDPLGLALENFNAMGAWRDTDQGLPIEGLGGKLITGESFASVRELKKLLVTERRFDYYRCITEKLLTYAIGRGPQPGDVLTVDAITEKLDQSNGKFSTLLTSIIESPAFQQRQRNP